MGQQAEGALRAGAGGVVAGLFLAARGQRQHERRQRAGGRAERDFQAAVMQCAGVGHVARRHQRAQRQRQQRQPQHGPRASGACGVLEADVSG
ncbi:hypothetical protein WJ976_30125 [Achromobacter denitrificans]